MLYYVDIDDVTEEYREVTVAESSFRQHYPEMLAEFDKSQDKQKGLTQVSVLVLYFRFVNQKTYF